MVSPFDKAAGVLSAAVDHYFQVRLMILPVIGHDHRGPVYDPTRPAMEVVGTFNRRKSKLPRVTRYFGGDFYPEMSVEDIWATVGKDKVPYELRSKDRVKVLSLEGEPEFEVGQANSDGARVKIWLMDAKPPKELQA